MGHALGAHEGVYRLDLVENASNCMKPVGKTGLEKSLKSPPTSTSRAAEYSHAHAMQKEPRGVEMQLCSPLGGIRLLQVSRDGCLFCRVYSIQIE